MLIPLPAKSLPALSCLAALFLVASCDPPAIEPADGPVTGWAPVYSRDTAWKAVTAEPPRSTVHAGKIYVKGTIIYQNEVKEGIHIIDASQPDAPRKIAFLRIAGSTELSVRGHFLYTNNRDDLVVIDIADPRHVREVSRVPHAFPEAAASYPPGHGYFECVDPLKGVVTGWERKQLDHPSCYR